MNGGLNVVLYDKLNEVISEGILDSILPFICAAAHQSHRNGNGKGKTSQIPICKDAMAEKSTTPRQSAVQDSRKTADGNALIPIHKDRNTRRRSSHSMGIASE